jgi:hypothetical protein
MQEEYRLNFTDDLSVAFGCTRDNGTIESLNGCDYHSRANDEE